MATTAACLSSDANLCRLVPCGVYQASPGRWEVFEPPLLDVQDHQTDAWHVGRGFFFCLADDATQAYVGSCLSLRSIRVFSTPTKRLFLVARLSGISRAPPTANSVLRLSDANPAKTASQKPTRMCLVPEWLASEEVLYHIATWPGRLSN